MKNQGKVSVVIPNFNKGSFALEAVESVLGQTHSDVEIIFVDDGSTDQSANLVAALAEKDARIKMHSTPSAMSGGSIARNIGICHSTGNYVVFLDSDDIMSPECIADRVKKIEENPDCNFLVFQMGIFKNKIGDTNLLANAKKDTPDLERFFRRDPPWLISGPIWRKPFLEKLNGFDTALISQQDADLHIRALIHEPRYFHYFENPDVWYRQNVQSLARAGSQSFDAIIQRSQMLQNHINLLKDRAIFTETTKTAIAQYLLDLALMLRWHKATQEQKCIKSAYNIWSKSHDFALVSYDMYRTGMAYIRFKHNMLWNRWPRIQQKRDKRFAKKLGDLIYTPSKTLSNTPFDAQKG